MSDARADDLAVALHEVRSRLAAACAASGRGTDEVRLVAVSKTFPAADVLRLAALGVRDFGESYDREAAAKAGALAAAAVDVRWHFVGGLQRNKCRSIAGYADVVHSVDRPEVVAALGSAAARAGREVAVLVQVSFDAAAGRSGCAVADVPRLADVIAGTEGVRLRGVMAVPPLGAIPRPVFARLRDVAEQLRAVHPDAVEVSAGMSGDLEDAIAEGATLVRVGTALFGERARHG